MKKIIKNYGIRTKLRLNLGIFSLFLVLIGIRLYYVFNKLEHINIGNVQELESKIRSITNFAKIELIIYMLAGLIVSVIFIRFISGYLVFSIKRINTALTNFNKGNIPPKIEIDNIDEFTPITRSINLLSENLKNVKEFAVEVGNSNYDTKINVFDNKGQLGDSLASMRDSLAKIAIERKIQAQEEKNRNWAITGLAKFSDILRTHNNDLAELGDEIITNMVKYMDANQGAIFALEEDQENSKNSTLSMIACYAWNKRRNYLEKKINIGEDLAGQAVLDKETIYLTEIPDDYVEITSGLGKTNPKSILIVPLKINDIILGVIEIASLNKFEKHHIEFVEKVGEGIASSMSTVKINLRTVDLLKQSQYQTEQLRSQEEEMRQNIEELNATQEEVERKNLEIRTTLNAINQTICVAEINMQGEILNANDYLLDTLGYRKDEFIGMNHSNFIMRDEANSSQYRIMWEELTTGKVKKVERKYIAKDGTEIWMLETLYPVKNINGDYFKIMAGMIDITETKMLLEETQKNNEAMKAQDEEIRQSMEELQASHEELERRQRELLEKDDKIKILDLSPEGIVVVNKEDFLIESVNLPFVNLTNYSEDELKDTNISKIFKSFDINSITVGKRRREETLRKDGSYFISDLTINEINEKNGGKYLFFLKDITKEVRNEEELIKTLENVEIQKKELTNKTEKLIVQDEEMKQNIEEMMATQEEIASKNAEFSGLFDSINKAASVIEYDINGKILHVNKIICDLSGYKMEELIGKHHSMLFDNKNIGQSEEYLRFWDKMRNGEHYEGIMKRIGKDNKPFIIKGICNPIFDKEGHLYKIMELAFEIEHKEIKGRVHSKTQWN